MVVRNKFDPNTAKVAQRPFKFNGVQFKVGDDFVAKKAKASPRQMKGLYNARRLKDKQEVVEARKVRPKKLSEAEELAKAKAEVALEEREAISGKLTHAKASILQSVADKEAEEAYDAQDDADKAQEEAKVAQDAATAKKAKKAAQARKRRAKAKAKKEAEANKK